MQEMYVGSNLGLLSRSLGFRGLFMLTQSQGFRHWLALGGLLD